MFRVADYYSMANELSRFKKLEKEIRKELNNMKEKTQELDIFWDGEANAEYLLRFNENMLTINICLERIVRSGTFLSYALLRYQNSEKKVRDLIETMI